MAVKVIFISFMIITVVIGVLKLTRKKQSDKKQIVNVVFRYDDFSTYSNTEIELEIIDIFRSNRNPITFGVIPYIVLGRNFSQTIRDDSPLTVEKGEILKKGFKKGRLEIALHGYSHKSNNHNKDSEFSGLDIDGQIERLAKGKILLEGIIGAPIKIFIPPWNDYDQNTIVALEQLGFSTISASNNGEVIHRPKLNFLPFNCTLADAKRVITVAKESLNNQPAIVILLHDFDFREVDEVRGFITIQEFSQLTKWVNAQHVVKVVSISEALQRTLY